MIEVTATANGYYGGKIRVPGEKFGINQPEDFSPNWMDTDDGKVVAYMKGQAKAKAPDDEPIRVPLYDQNANKRVAHESRKSAASEWLENRGKSDEDEAPETRRVNTGGTDGVVGVDVPKAGAKVSPKDRKALAQSATGKKPKSTAEADETLAALAGSGGSDNDDRSRDMAIDQSQNPTPSDDWSSPKPVDD